MAVAIIAVILALTGSAFAANALITGGDIKDRSITRADLSKKTIRSLKGKRGKEGPAGRDGFVGPKGPQGDVGPAGPAGPKGDKGDTGDKGNTGDTGATGRTGIQGPQGDPGPQGDSGQAGAPGQALVTSLNSNGLVDVGTALRLDSTGPTSSEGADIGNTGDAGTFLSSGQYRVDVFVSFVDPNAGDAGLEYGVARLYLGTTVLDGVNVSSGVGFSFVDTTLVTSDVPDDQTNAAQASGSFIINVGNDADTGGEMLMLRGAVRTAEPDGASAWGYAIVSAIS
jgi:hypothetical protein